jgi:hypothetical protein
MDAEQWRAHGEQLAAEGEAAAKAWAEKQAAAERQLEEVKVGWADGAACDLCCSGNRGSASLLQTAAASV